MTFKEKIIDYILGNIHASQLPDIAMTGLLENLESDSLIILAGMTQNDDAVEKETYFNRAMMELKIDLPTKMEAVKAKLKFYLTELVNEPSNAYSIMEKIDYKLYKQIDWSIITPRITSDFVGEELGLQHMYTWFRELQDFEDGGMLLYYNELSKEDQKQKFAQNLVEEAAKLLKKLQDERS
ncbi:MAG: hypothetical protein WBP41_16945 [Saprospiraceae bacterium]